MLTHARLVELYRELREENVLSVYIDADQHDPAERNKWRIRLDHEVARCRKRLNGNQEELQQFERAWRQLQGRLENFDAFVPDKGWVGFATPEQIWYAENVNVPMPDAVYWERGMRVAPYVRGLKQERTVIVVLLDSEKARVFRYRDGEVREVEDVRADVFMGDLTDVESSKRARRSTGMRGETGTDTAQRVLEVSSDRMVKHLMGVAAEAVGDHGFLVLGGTTEMVAKASAAVPKAIHPRLLMEPPSVHVNMTDPEVKAAVDRAASLLTKRYQEDLLAQLIDLARAGGRACLGVEETEQALREMRVDTLLVSRNFVRDHVDFADMCVGMAFAQDAMVEELSDLGATRLDREGGGIGARLRFQIRQNGDRPEMQTGGDESRHHPPR